MGESSRTHLLVEVARRPEAETASALDRLVTAGLLFQPGRPPARHLFVQARTRAGRGVWDACCANPDARLHARIAETLEGSFAEIAENQPK